MKYFIIFVLGLISLCRADDVLCKTFDENTKSLEFICSISTITLPDTCGDASFLIKPLQVKELKIRGCGRDTLDYSIAICPNLLSLDVSFSGYKSLDVIEIGHKRIERINASHNNLYYLPWSLNRDILGKYPELIELNLSHNQLMVIQFTAYSGIQKLKRINLSHNKILSLNEESFANLTQLEYIDVSNNDITWIDSIPFIKLRSLKELHMENNPNSLNGLYFQCRHFLKMASISVFLSFDKLEVFSTFCDGTKLHVVPNSESVGFFPVSSGNYEIHCNEGTFKNVRSFEAGSNKHDNILEILKCLNPKLLVLQLNDNSVGHLNHHTFQKFENLTNLNLRATNLSELDFSVFENLKKLQELDISNNDLEYVYSSSSLKTFENLTHFSAAGNQFWNAHEIIQHLPASIEYLDLSGSFVGALDVHTFEKFENLMGLKLSRSGLLISDFQPFERLINLRSLDISYNRLGKLNFTKQTVETLDLSGNFVGKMHAATFQNFKTVRTLKLSNTNLSFSGSNPFDKLEYLRILDISHNNLENVDFSVFETTLKRLNGFSASYCHIKNAFEVFQLLGRRLEAMDLSGNFIGDVNADTFKGKSNLKHVLLNNASLSHFDLNVLHECRFLSSLQIAYNQLSDIDVGGLKSTSLKELILTGNELEEIKNLNQKRFFMHHNDAVLSISKNRLPCATVTQIVHEFRDAKFIDDPYDQKHSEHCRQEFYEASNTVNI